MGRCPLLSVASIGLFLLYGGCAGKPIVRNPFEPLESRTSAQKLAAKPKAKPRSDQETDGDGHRSNSTADRLAAGSPQDRASQDAATQALIERELRDATPEQRDQLIAEFDQMRPDMVRQILRVRRMTLNSPGQRASDAETADATTALASRTDGEGQPPVRSAVTAGLGTVNPWSASGHPSAAPPSQQANQSITFAAGHTSPAGQNMTPAALTGTLTLDEGADPASSSGTVSQAGLNPENPFGYSLAAATTDRGTVANATANGVLPPSGVSAGVAAPALPGAAAPIGTVAPPPSGLSNATAVASAAPTPSGNLVPGQYSTAATVNQQALYNGQSVQTAVVPAAAPSVAQPGAALSNGVLPPGSLSAAPAGPDASWTTYLQKIIDVTAAEAAQTRPGTTEPEKQAYIEKQVYLRMLYLMAGQQERALQAIPGLDSADQEFWQQTFWGLANYFDAKAIPATADRATQTVAQLTTAVLRLQEKANLELRNVAFCHKISSFGNYERFARDEFSPGQPILLYAEVGNFHSEPTADGQYRTILRSTLEIHKAGTQGDLVESNAFPATEDICRNHRRDYFHSYEYTIPPKISLGPHVLKLIVEDQLSRKIATYTLNFTVK